MDILNVSKSIFDPFDAYYKNYPVIHDTITFSDSFTELLNHEFFQSLSFSDSFSIEGTFDRTLSDNLSLNSYTIIYSPILWNESISFSDVFDTHIYFETISQNLTFNQSFNRQLHNTPAFSDVLFFDDTWHIKYKTNFDINQQLFLIDNFGLHGHYTFAFHDQLSFSEDHVSELFDNEIITLDVWQVTKDSTECFNPFIYLNSLTSAIKLESPVFGDLQANINEISINRTINGSRFSYIKTSRRKHLKYEFNLRCNKYLELLDFIDQSYLNTITLTNWKNEVWMVRLVNDPIELKAPSRDMYSITLEFEGYLVKKGIYKCQE